MTRVKTECEVQVYEVNGNEETRSHGPVRVSTHPVWDDRIVLQLAVNDLSEEVTVLASDLLLAVKRCSW